MTQYIDKSALVAEIERRIAAYRKNFDKVDINIARILTDGKIEILKEILSFLDTLKAKEVELDKEYMDEINSHLKSIVETIDRMTSGNLMHHKASIRFSANTIARVLELMGFKSQKG